MKSEKLRIEEPITEQDFLDSIELVRKTLFWEKGLQNEFKSLSSGELLIAKAEDKIVGVLSQRRPGKIFTDWPEEYFDLENIQSSKENIGYIAIIAVDKQSQGKGIGKKMIARALKLQEEFGSKAIAVHVSQNSPGGASEKLFRSFGFEPVKLYEKPWEEISREKGLEGFVCAFCGNPCVCDELEMIKYLK